MLSAVYDKFNQSQSQAGKKKKNIEVGNQMKEFITAKEKVSITLDVLRELRGALNASEVGLGK